MKRCCAFRCLFDGGIGAALTMLICGAPGLAQKSGGGDEDIRLEAPKFDAEQNTKLMALRDGRQGSISDAQKAQLYERAAQWLLYRFTQQEYQSKKYQEGVPLGSEQMTTYSLMQDVIRFVPVPDPKKPAFKPAQWQYLQEFARAMLPAIRTVMKNPVPIARINSAIVLARLGEAEQEDAADVMCDALEDKNQIDAVKLHASVGLTNLFKADQFREAGLKNKERESRCILLLIDFIGRKPTFSGHVTPEEVAAYRYVRRAAIRALGQTRLPAIVKNKNMVVGRSALTLLKVVAKDGLTPEPSLSEQLEATFGLCQLQSKQFSDIKNGPAYQPDYAVYHVAQFVVEFVDKNQADRNSKSKTEAWRFQSGRLREALTAWRTDLAEKYRFTADKNQYLTNLFEKCLQLVQTVEANNPANANALRNWLVQNRPKDSTLFSGMADSAVKAPEAAEN